MSSIDTNSEKDVRNGISVKKSTFFGLVIGLVIISVIAAFFVGMYISNLNSNNLSQEYINDEIAKLELKILQSQLTENKQKSPSKISMDDDAIIGNPNAPITIIEFSDFQCPFCAKFHTQTLPLLYEQYIKQDKVKIVFRDFPIQSIHPNALPASAAAECAHEQNQFEEMHNKLFENQKEWSNLETSNALSMFNQYAMEMELDEKMFFSCLNSGKYIDEIKNDLNDGRNYGVSGTPGFFVGNDEVGFVEIKGAQPFDSFKKVIDKQLDS